MQIQPTTTKTIQEMYAAGKGVDNSAVFEKTWSILSSLVDKLKARFELTPHPSSEKWKKYQSADGKYQGSMNGFSGPEIDWIMWSWLGNPTEGFTNQHLNIWLGPQVRVPHLTIVFGTVPQLFTFMDMPPRVDLWTNPEYVDRNYEALNADFIKLRNDPRLTYFVSQSTYMRVALSPAHTCYSGQTDLSLIDDLGKHAHKLMDHWIKLVDNAEPVPFEERPQLLARDRFVRSTVAHRDPVNDLAFEMLGQDLGHQLVDALWGVDRGAQP